MNTRARRVLIFLLKSLVIIPLSAAVLWMEYQIAALLIDMAMERPYVLTGTELWWSRNAVWCILVLGSIYYYNRCKFGH